MRQDVCPHQISQFGGMKTDAFIGILFWGIKINGCNVDGVAAGGFFPIKETVHFLLKLLPLFALYGLNANLLTQISEKLEGRFIGKMGGNYLFAGFCCE